MGALRKVLVANRGEIARRIFRTCRRLGIATVAVYSDADERALFVREADEAVRLGGPLAKDSYLNVDLILAAALKTGADAIHPGYGFLSENADFAQRCEEAGLVFIGPSAQSIRAIGSKRGAKLLLRAREPSVPVIPGYDGEDQSVATLAREAERVGYPVLLKASAGGGGKGMRVVARREELAEAVDGAKTEARNSFGDESLLLERYFTAVRHVEVQLLGDRTGRATHLYERECSVQRRHQKIIEESPSPVMTPALRARMGEAAVRVAELIGYRNAGTAEFIVTDEGDFFFLEVNTRLQVEHPVTELVTGLDLVEIQIRLAEGATLAELGLLPASKAAAPVPCAGHALEVRLYAEDACNSFFPATGTLHAWHAPALPGVRFDSAVAAGAEVSVYYDPLLCKVIAHAPTRPAAIALMLRALSETVALGVTTNRAFLQQVLAHPDFAAGRLCTAFIDRHLPPAARLAHATAGAAPSLVAALLADWAERDARRTLLRHVPPRFRTNPYAWAAQSFASRAPAATTKLHYQLVLAPGEAPRLPLAFQIRRDDAAEAEAAVLHAAEFGADQSVAAVDATVGGVRRRFRVARVAGAAPAHEEDALLVGSALGDFAFTLVSRFAAKGAAGGDGAEERVYLAPMPAKVYKLLVKNGDKVTKGTPLLVIESMKMETKVYALRDGVVAQVSVAEGQLVTAGQLLLEVR